MSLLSTKARVSVVSMLVEGASIASTVRYTGTSKPTILKLLLRLGEGCDRLHDRLVRHLTVTHVQTDELHSWCGKRQKNLSPNDPPEWGEQWTFVAMASVSKLVIAYRVGKRDQATTDAFIADMRRRLLVVPQVNTDGFKAYPDAIGASFADGAVDYGILIKNTSKKPAKGKGAKKNAEKPAEPFITKRAVYGNPDMDLVSTSFIERQNLTIRMHIRRLTRKSNGYSKKVENHRAAMALHFAWYNWCRIHESLRVTPAMECGLTDHVWSIEELINSALEEPVGEAPQAVPLKLREDGTTARTTSTGAVLRAIPGGKTSSNVVPLRRPVRLTKAWEQLGLFDDDPSA